jgi:hypothetical protein
VPEYLQAQREARGLQLGELQAQLGGSRAQVPVVKAQVEAALLAEREGVFLEQRVVGLGAGRSRAAEGETVRIRAKIASLT